MKQALWLVQPVLGGEIAVVRTANQLIGVELAADVRACPPIEGERRAHIIHTVAVGETEITYRLISAGALAVIHESTLREARTLSACRGQEIFVTRHSGFTREVVPEAEGVLHEARFAGGVGDTRIEFGAAVLRNARVARVLRVKRTPSRRIGSDARICSDVRIGHGRIGIGRRRRRIRTPVAGVELGGVDSQNRVAAHAGRHQGDEEERRGFHRVISVPIP